MSSSSFPLGACLALSLSAWMVADVALVAGLARQTWWRGAIALVLPPLALAWGWNAGMRTRAYAWGAALVAYAIAVAIAL